MNTVEETQSLRAGDTRGLGFEVIEKVSKEDITCGFGPFRGPLLQRFATKNVYVFLYGILGLVSWASWAYFNGTIYTMEKRFKIPSKTLGFMNLATNASQLFMSTVLGYWAGRGHRPRWIAFCMLMAIGQMILTVMPHVIYGPGTESLLLTEEYGYGGNTTYLSVVNQRRELCNSGEPCSQQRGSFVQPALLFLGRFVGGIGGGLFHTVGISYIDDNINKSESPIIISLSFFIRMLGPSMGYAVASICLKWYVAPTLTPRISPDDPRWIGAWWIGWIAFIIATTILTIPLSMFPKVLPEAALKQNGGVITADEPPPSLKGMIETTKRLLKNRLFVYNNMATVMYIMGESPYWMFLAKYIETLYQQNASYSNFIAGTMTLVTSAVGILLSGVLISYFRPTARSLAAWNVFIAAATVCGCVAYIFIDCKEATAIAPKHGFNYTQECNAHCDCENVPYSPVCSEENQMFISPCHAGCQEQEQRGENKVFIDCACVKGGTGTVTPGLCPTDCTNALRAFLIVLCILKLLSSSGIVSNFLVGVRCVDVKDKSAGMGFSLTLIGALGFAPAPVLYGYIIDMNCTVWGKTCDGTGNCWLYDGPQLAYTLNIIAALFLIAGTAFDTGVWYHSKKLKIFD